MNIGIFDLVLFGGAFFSLACTFSILWAYEVEGENLLAGSVMSFIWPIIAPVFLVALVLYHMESDEEAKERQCRARYD